MKIRSLSVRFRTVGLQTPSTRLWVSLLNATESVKMAKTLHEDKGLDVKEICKQMQISRSTFYRLVNVKKILNYARNRLMSYCLERI